MSFASLEPSYGRPGGPSGGYGGGPGRQRGSGRIITIEQLSQSLNQFQQNLSLFQRLVEQLDTRNPESQAQVRDQMAVVNDLSIRIGQQLTDQVQQIEQKPPAEANVMRATHAKLSKDYQRVLDQFRQVRERAQRRLSSMGGGGPMPAAGSNGRVVRDRAVMEQDKRLQVQMQEQAINEAILREREEEIQQINSDVRKVNEIFRDINDIVKDQQQEIDAVESMIEKSHQHAKSGLDQVEKANENNGCTIC